MISVSITHHRLPKYMPGMKSRFIFILAVVCVWMLSACNTDQNPVTRISLDFPHGGLRLLVQRDGDTRLFYGALPHSRIVKSGTFDVDELFQQLQPQLHDNSPGENPPSGQPFGIATLEFADGTEQDYLIYDEAFAEALFKTACANIVDEEDAGKEIFTAQCANLGDPST
jgi:hypothetical protein